MSRHIIDKADEVQHNFEVQREKLEQERHRIMANALNIQKASEELAYRSKEAVSVGVFICLTTQ